MVQRIQIAVTPDTFDWLEEIRDSQDGADAEPIYVDVPAPSGSDRLHIAVTPDTLEWLETIRDKQDGGDAEPIYIEVPGGGDSSTADSGPTPDSGPDDVDLSKIVPRRPPPSEREMASLQAAMTPTPTLGGMSPNMGGSGVKFPTKVSPGKPGAGNRKGRNWSPGSGRR